MLRIGHGLNRFNGLKQTNIRYNLFHLFNLCPIYAIFFAQME